MPTKLQVTFAAEIPKGDVIKICLIGKDSQIIPILNQTVAAHLIDAMAAFKFTGAFGKTMIVYHNNVSYLLIGIGIKLDNGTAAENIGGVLFSALAETGAKPVGTMVIGTVKGDIHDIGKNLVGMMMEGAGFEVIDIGINNSVEDYFAALEEHKPDILGMSALLTTTMPYMKVVIDEMVNTGIRDNYIVLVGGAPLNEEFGTAVGADRYCRDAAEAAAISVAMVAERQAAHA